MTEETRQRQRERAKQWMRERPGYAARWREKFKQWQAEEKAKGVDVLGPRLPRVPVNRIAYEIKVTNPLREEERYVQPKPKAKKSVRRRGSNVGSTSAFDDFDNDHATV